MSVESDREAFARVMFPYTWAEPASRLTDAQKRRREKNLLEADRIIAALPSLGWTKQANDTDHHGDSR